MNLFPERVRYGYGYPFPTEEIRYVDKQFAVQIRRRKEIDSMYYNRWSD